MLGACSSDAPDYNGEEPVANNGDGYYLRVELPATQTTRGDNHPYVTDVNNASFSFFRADGTHIATRRVGYGGTGSVSNDGGVISWLDATTQEGAAHEGSKRCAVLQLSSVPAYVECLINANDNATAITGTMEDREESSTHRSGTSQNFLKMSTAVYYEQLSGNTKACNVTYIDPSKNLFTSEEGAKNLNETGKEALKIYVEPIAANINVTETLAENIDDIDNYTVNSENVDEVSGATVSFHPEYYFLTAYRTTGYTLKHLNNYSSLLSAVQSWSGKTNENAEYSFNWVSTVPGNVTYANWANVVAGNSSHYCFGTTASSTRYQFTTEKTTLKFYPFENTHSDTKAACTNIVVAGKYTVKKDTKAEGETEYADLAYTNDKKAADEAWNKTAGNENKQRTIEEIGTFYLIGIGTQFQVVSSESEVYEFFDLDPYDTENSKLVMDGVSGSDYSGWTGKLYIKDKKYLGSIIKYKGGYGYYAKAIDRFEADGKKYHAIVRNTQYNLTVKSIKGMGVGIPGDIPIIPVDPPKPKDDNAYLHMAIFVNPWVVLSTQDVEW